MKLRFVVAAAFGCLVAVSSAQAGTMEGSYRVQGRNLDGSAYSGRAVISITSRTDCRITWTLSDGSTSVGKCIHRGASFATSYKLGNDRGLAIYERQPDGRLIGSWTDSRNDVWGEELLTPMR